MWVVYIDIDSLRPDHLGCYGYGRNTSPNIDRLAKQGIRFARAYTSDSPCMPSRAALISGTHGITNGVVTHERSGGPFRDPLSSLPWVLRNQGIPTAAISSFGRHPAPWFYVGWNEYMDPIDRPSLSFQQIDGQTVADRALDWMNDHRDLDDAYLYVQMWDPHAFYEAPESFVEMVKSDHYPAHPTREEFESHCEDSFWHSARGVGLNTYEDWKRMIDEYDAEIRYADYQVGRLLDALTEVKKERDVLVILAADHGEEHGEHGVYVEHWSVYNGTQQIPLIVSDSRRTSKGTVHEGLVLQLDITATICDALGVTPPSHWDSLSLLSQVDDPTVGRSHIVCGHGLYTAQRTVITSEWKFIRTYHPGLWDLPRTQLFGREDVWEQNNVMEEHPDKADYLDRLLREWEETHRIGMDPMMSNAAKAPAGLGYAAPWTEGFRNHTRAPLPFVLDQRKPDPLLTK